MRKDEQDLDMSKIYTAVGLMSGTSLDGVDAAVLKTDGVEIHGFGPTAFRPFTDEEKQVLHEATQAALVWNFTGPPPNIFASAETIIHKAHIEVVRQLGVDNVDLIGFHGQTILHRPPEGGKNGQTLQLGEGHALAGVLGIDVAYDFRSADMAVGGQGAPLAPIYHEALLRRSKTDLPAAVLNIGGVSNITILTADGILLASDCGPGNGPLDSWIKQCGLGDYDKDGVLSMRGTPDFALIEKWLQADFFKKPPPASADRWDFDVLDDLRAVRPEDGATSLAVFTAISIKKCITYYGQAIEKIIVCGGGRHNPAILLALHEQNIGHIVTAEQAGWNGDDLEAQAFAYLAVRSAKALPLSYPKTTGAKTPMSGGKIVKTLKN